LNIYFERSAISYQLSAKRLPVKDHSLPENSNYDLVKYKMIKIYSQHHQGKSWLTTYQNQKPMLACILGFTATGLIPGISAAGATPEARKYTAIADGEFLVNGVTSNPRYPLPPLDVGVSPVFISRAVVEGLGIPVKLFNAGLPVTPVVPYLDLGGIPAQCLTSGQALPLPIVKHLFEQGLFWGEILAQEAAPGYLIIAECVVGGTTTALGLLTGLGIKAQGKINSSHPQCNHQQKWELVQRGLEQARLTADPLTVVAAVGDPMQIVAAGMAIAASNTSGVLLAGGTQMLAVYALIEAIVKTFAIKVNLAEIVVGTTRWVAEDPTGDTVGLAQEINNATLLGTELNFRESCYPSLRVYEEGYVKEGVGAGGCAIAASLSQGWIPQRILKETESLVKSYYQLSC
jgi:uncharacterized protein (TIGR00303 family)